MIRLITGLGNPGSDYAATRHNAGFWFVDALARRLKVSLAPERAYSGLAARASVDGQALWLLEPTTFMNLSGKSVSALARFFKIEPHEILVVHDELDLLPGQAKLKLGGSAAGHNGLKDIHAQLGTPDYWRLRLGIGHPGVKSEVIHYVLRKPAADERTEIRQEHRAIALGDRPGAARRHGQGDHEDQCPAAQAEAGEAAESRGRQTSRAPDPESTS